MSSCHPAIVLVMDTTVPGSSCYVTVSYNIPEPRIDSEVTIPPAYVAWQAGTTNRVVVPTRQAWNRFLGSLEGLQIRALNHYPKEFLLIQSSLEPMETQCVDEIDIYSSPK
jgi:hypothetical protein